MKDDMKMEEQDKRLEWVAPAITEWDVVAETQSGNFPNQPIFDGSTSYS